MIEKDDRKRCQKKVSEKLTEKGDLLYKVTEKGDLLKKVTEKDDLKLQLQQQLLTTFSNLITKFSVSLRQSL